MTFEIKGTVLRSGNGYALTLAYEFGDSVSIDGGSVVGTIVGFCVYPHDIEYRVSWWSNGDLKQEWLSQTRLRKEAQR